MQIGSRRDNDSSNCLIEQTVAGRKQSIKLGLKKNSRKEHAGYGMSWT